PGSPPQSLAHLPAAESAASTTRRQQPQPGTPPHHSRFSRSRDVPTGAHMAFQELCHPESTYLEKAPAAQLTRIDAADRLFSVPLTRITSVPECAVSSVGFLWGPPAVSRTCGVSVG